MRHTSGDKKPNVAPVKSIELPTKHIRGRTIAAIVFLVIAVVSIAIGIGSCFKVEGGFTQITATEGASVSAQEFLFMYDLGKTEMAVNLENKEISDIFTQAALKADVLFDATTSNAEVGNVAYVNASFNKNVQVAQFVYQSFKVMADNDLLSYLYLAPVYDMYKGLFMCDTDSFAKEFDAVYNKEYVNQCLSYALDESHVKLELLGNNTVCLKVSDDYATFLEQNKCPAIDFYWMKNAFIADFFADTFVSSGHTNGYFVSYDGFTRNIDKRGVEYLQQVWQKENAVGIYAYDKASAMVYLRNYATSSLDQFRFYTYEDKTTRSTYVGLDGLSHSAFTDVMCYSSLSQVGCAQILAKLLPVFVADTVDGDVLATFKSANVNYMYTVEKVVHTNDQSLVFKKLQEGYSVKTL